MKQKGDFEIEIIVLDNSCDLKNTNTLIRHSGLDTESIIISKENIGYSKGNNSAVKQSTGEYILILNPDIEWEDKNTLNTLFTHLQKDPDIGIIGPRQEERSGYLALTTRAFPKWHVQVARRTFLKNIPWFKTQVEHDEMRHMDRTKTQEVDWLQSSCFLLSRDTWNTLGGFNEEYFLFLADTEICKKCWEINKKVTYFAGATVYSDGIRCSDGGVFSIFSSPSLRSHIKDSWKYFRNNN